jgi:hypothetical protein
MDFDDPRAEARGRRGRTCFVLDLLLAAEISIAAWALARFATVVLQVQQCIVHNGSSLAVRLCNPMR